MYSVLIDALRQWNKDTDRQSKLQHLYIIAAIIVLVVAGLVSLLNFDLGQRLLSVALGLAAVFVVNAIAWALADSFIVSRLAKRSNKR